MRHFFFFFVILVGFVGCKNEGEEQVAEAEIERSGPDIPVLDFAGVEPLLNYEDHKTYVVNFWATWCKPCIEELPAFEAIQEKYRDKGVEVLLVNLDFPEKLESEVVPFIEKHGIRSGVVLLDDVDSNTWIPKVDENWSGAIPATLIYNKKERKFYEASFTYEELETELNTFIK